MSVLQDLYHSEINFTISTFWDGGFDVKLGDKMNGYVDEGNFDRWGMVESWLISATIEHFPDSLFARMYRDGVHAWLSTNEPHP
jgi:hypothetical protein